MPERIQSLGSRGLHLFALCGFAFTQPLLDQVGRHAAFLAAHDLSAGEIWLLLLAVLALPPAGLWLLEAAVGLVAARLAGAVHSFFVALLTAAALLPFVHRAEGVTGDVAVAVSLAAGAFASVAYTGSPRLRRLVTWLALAPVVFAGVFVARAPIAAQLFQPRLSEPLDVRVGSAAPVMIVVFDELPLVSLLSARERIDAAMFPAFSRLSQRSTWYRNASAVDATTAGAIPALLTGRYPEPGRQPTVEDHPDNLFRLLAGHREMRVSEFRTRLWQSPPSLPEGPVRRLRVLGSDLGILYLHILLPHDLSERLPPPSHGWRALREDAPNAPRVESLQSDDSPEQTVRRALASVKRGERPAFWYLNVELPRRPWRFLPSGRSYLPTTDYGLQDGVWKGSEWWVTQAYQRHLLQLELADRLLGQILDRLESEGLFDETLLVVTSDRGVGFWAEQPFQDPAGMEHPEDVLSIPLFLKLPGQSEGAVDPRNAESIDVVPTVAAVLDVEVPWKVEGCSLLNEDCPQRAKKVIFDRAGERLELPWEIVRRPQSLRHKLSWFTPGEPLSLFRLGRFQALVGVPVSALPTMDDPEASIVLDREPFTYTAARPDEMALGRVVGVLDGYSRRKNKAFVGVAANGVLGAVVPALDRPGGRFLFSAMLPERARPTRADDLQLFLLEGSSFRPRVWKVRFQLGNLRAELAAGEEAIRALPGGGKQGGE